MARTSEDTTKHQPSEKCVHTQESGDAGLSSDLEHKATVDYSPIPQPNKGSSVRTITKEEHDFPEMKSPHPSKAEVVFAEKSALNPPPVQNNLAHSSRHEEEMQLDDHCIIEHDKMDTQEGTHPAKRAAKAAVKVRARGRRSDGKILKGFVVFLAMASVCDRVSAKRRGKCFSCMDEDRCPKAITIYDNYDNVLYARGNITSFPECTDIPTLDSKTCHVCNEKRSAPVSIWCSDDVDEFVVETEDQDDDIENITLCAHGLTEDPARDGAAHEPVALIWVAVVVTLVICKVSLTL
ncbi:uncharacterized protein LOC114448675 isoform X2 [Parambassis ranga]|uniref:Uncharacterized protein LOC114448675 isoform X2 n=1 Tax=Parambassis ranga TaxID=210632 RepID=A0A6P7JX79_9TELE|nr:uncharacterized protein LOC114448675 isoform X2 [Parambassis ranga]